MKRIFSWDENKALANHRKHGVSFTAALQVFSDPLALSFAERIENGETRWQTIGYAGGVLILLVVHTVQIDDNEEHIRIISARKADKAERRMYENG